MRTARRVLCVAGIATVVAGSLAAAGPADLPMQAVSSGERRGPLGQYGRQAPARPFAQLFQVPPLSPSRAPGPAPRALPSTPRRLGGRGRGPFVGWSSSRSIPPSTRGSSPALPGATPATPCGSSPRPRASSALSRPPRTRALPPGRVARSLRGRVAGRPSGGRFPRRARNRVDRLEPLHASGADGPAAGRSPRPAHSPRPGPP